MDVGIEREIVIGLITSTEYHTQIKNEWNSLYIESQAAKLLCNWSIEYFDTHSQAPLKNIESILFKKLKNKKVKKELAEEIETDILQSLNDEYESKSFDLKVLLYNTREYFIKRQLELHQEEVNAAIAKGEIIKAKELQDNFKFIIGGQKEGIDLADSEVDNKIEEAFDTNNQNVIKFSGALGEFWNDELTKGSFVSILAPEKRGKTFLLLEFLMTAYSQGKRVALFQAGDMTEAQQIIRMAIYLTQKSNKAKFCGKQYIPVLDCVKNQTDTCNRKIRACKFGIFKDKTEKQIREEITYEELIEAKEGNKFYRNCYNCLKWQTQPWGTVWLEEFDNGTEPLTANEAKRARRKFFKDKNKVRLSTHANGELTIPKMNAILDMWALEGFIPELILADYADLITATEVHEVRHQIDKVWKGLRGMSQKRNALTVAPTQADANSYEQYLLKLTNFSEDKRKLAHVTAMYGLNQSPDGREKKIGIMRINKIVVREDGFHYTDQVHLLQRLQIGQPNLGSYF